MIGQDSLIIAWTLLGVFLLIGLIVHEKTGLRLGGVLVLPLLLVYAIFDLNAVAVFAIAAVLALMVGQVVYSRTFLYGRRLLYVFLLIGVATTIFARQFVDLALGGIVLALLPGLFAYNLHREGRYVEGASAFMAWFGILLVAGVAVTWLITQPGQLEGMWRAAGSSGWFGSLDASWAATAKGWSQTLLMAESPIPGFAADGALPAGAAAIGAVEAMQEGGAE